MPEELLVPFAEQTRPLAVGDRHPIGLYVDATGRLAGTMRVSEMLKGSGSFAQDEWVTGEAWRNDPDRGVFVIVERRFVGLLPRRSRTRSREGTRRSSACRTCCRTARFELSLRRPAHEELESDAEHVLAVLTKSGAKVGDSLGSSGVSARTRSG